MSIGEFNEGVVTDTFGDTRRWGNLCCSERQRLTASIEFEKPTLMVARFALTLNQRSALFRLFGSATFTVP